MTDHPNRSPGYALTLLAESTTGALHCSEAISKPGVTPEDIALQSTYSLLTEIERGGCIDRLHQPLVLLYMVLGSEDVGRCVMSEPTARTYEPSLCDARTLDCNPDLLFQNTVSERCQRVLWHILQNCSPSRIGNESPRVVIRMLWYRLC